MIPCTLKSLPKHLELEGIRVAGKINPINHPYTGRLSAIAPRPEFLAVMITRYWQIGGVKLGVKFIDGAPQDLQARILAHCNAWTKTANVQFVLSNTDPQVRIARTPGDGYWSYLGTDILSIPKDEPTMNLDSFTMNTPESEYKRVVRHESGHTLGFPHEHVRRELVALIDPAKAIPYFERTQGWSAQDVRDQVLTPIEEKQLLGTEKADPESIMCYQLPGSITYSGKPIIGGSDIDAEDYAFVAKIYPINSTPPPKPKRKGCFLLRWFA